MSDIAYHELEEVLGVARDIIKSREVGDFAEFVRQLNRMERLLIRLDARKLATELKGSV